MGTSDLRVALVVAHLIWSCEARSLVFQGDAGPQLNQLHARYRFFLPESLPQGGRAALQVTNVTFTVQESQGAQRAEGKEGGARTLQLAVLPISEFSELLAQNASICNQSYRYLGCYQEEAQKHVHLNFQAMTSGATPRACHRACGGYAFFGLQYSGQCWCGDGPELGDLVADTSCNMFCTELPSTMCGGQWRSSTYQVLQDAARHVGCFKESQPVHERLPHRVLETSPVTPSSCRAACTMGGHGFAGLQYGHECWCGNSSDLGPRLADAECSTPCVADPTRTCGGPWKSSIYELVEEADAFEWSQQSSNLATVSLHKDVLVSAEVAIPGGGPHMLVVANCMVAGGVLLSGSVSVRNPWGFLDAIDRWKVPVYGCALVLTTLACAGYVVALWRQEEKARQVQWFLLLLGLVGVAEALGHCALLYQENLGGAAQIWYTLVEACYVGKVAYLITFFAQAANGLGLLVHRLNCWTQAKCLWWTSVYMAASMPKLYFLSSRHHSAIPTTRDELTTCVGPLVGICGLAVLWLARAGRSTLSKLRVRDDLEGVQALKRLAVPLLLLVAGGAVALVGQVNLSVEEARQDWHFALWNDAVASACFLVVTCTMMVHSMGVYEGKSLQMGVVGQVVDQDGDVMGAPDMADGDVESFGRWKARGPAVATIGATARWE